MTPPVRILAVPGALRRGSFNRALAAAAVEEAPDGVDVSVHGLEHLPLYDGDVESAGMPDGVRAFRDALGTADAALLCSPEYNASVPGVLKNALDWASRGDDSPLTRLPVGLAGASPGRFGTVRSQAHLRQVLAATGALVLPKPELYVAGARALFADGRLSDEETRARLRTLLSALAEWTRAVR